jgi:SAM-dependent methyltransferase
VSDAVRDYYDADPQREWDRLAQPYLEFEYLSTLYLIERYFPSAGRVCDIGGGPGRYALEMRRRGFRASLVDVSPALVEFARGRLAEAGHDDVDVYCGDARDLSMLKAESYDAVLLMGPCYHLVEAAHRRSALDETRRILKRGGVAIIGYLNAWGILRTALHDFPQRCTSPEDFRKMLSPMSHEHELAGFTECHWSTPPAAVAEVREAGFEVISYAGCEGFAGGIHETVRRLASEHSRTYAALRQFVPQTCELPQYRDATDHLRVVVRKTANGVRDSAPGSTGSTP